MKRKGFLLAVLLAFTVLIAAPAGATMVYMTGVNFPATISATADFDYDPNTAVIDVVITNTSSAVSALTAHPRAPIPLPK